MNSMKFQAGNFFSHHSQIFFRSLGVFQVDKNAKAMQWRAVDFSTLFFHKLCIFENRKIDS